MDYGSYVADAFAALTPDLEGLYEQSKDVPVSDIRLQQQGVAATSGAVAFALPGAHLPAAAADLTILMNRMAVASYAIGASKGSAAGHGNFLEPEDFQIVLALWSGHTELADLVDGAETAAERNALLEDAGVMFLARNALKSIGVVASARLGQAMAARIGAQIAARSGAKTVAGFVPLLGAAIGAGANWHMLSTLCDAAERYYNWKCGPQGHLERPAAAAEPA